MPRERWHAWRVSNLFIEFRRFKNINKDLKEHGRLTDENPKMWSSKEIQLAFDWRGQGQKIITMVILWACLNSMKDLGSQMTSSLSVTTHLGVRVSFTSALVGQFRSVCECRKYLDGFPNNRTDEEENWGGRKKNWKSKWKYVVYFSHQSTPTRKVRAVQERS